jgi:hypothetical protein
MVAVWVAQLINWKGIWICKEETVAAAVFVRLSE